MIDQDKLAKLCEAKEVLCELCNKNICEKCQVSQITNDSFNEIGEERNSL